MNCNNLQDCIVFACVLLIFVNLSLGMGFEVSVVLMNEVGDGEGEGRQSLDLHRTQNKVLPALPKTR